jgi:hypothetical protein
MPAKFHVLELIPYIGGLVLGPHFAGIQGAAWAWCGRAAVDAALLFSAPPNLSKATPPAEWRPLVHGGFLTAAACIASLTILHVQLLRLAVGGALVVVFVARA